YFIEFLQILVKLLFKEDENRSNNDDTNTNDDDDKQQQQQQLTSDQHDMEINHTESIVIDEDIEQAYDTKLTDIP
ncbi:unnamed protein product, partial [Rotaria magnacalcarata]